MRKPTQAFELIETIHEYGINIHSRELWLNSNYDAAEHGEPGIEYRNAVTFEKNINILNSFNKEPILIHMHTIGGMWNDGVSIYDIIRSCPNIVTMLAYANAESMSSIVLQAADYRIMMPNTDFMIHYGSHSFTGDSIGFVSNAEWTKKTNQKLLNMYAKRCVNGQYFKSRNFSEDKIKRFLDNKMKRNTEWYLTANEAVEYGFADGVLGDKGYETIDKLKCLGK